MNRIGHFQEIGRDFMVMIGWGFMVMLGRDLSLLDLVTIDESG